MTHLTIFNTIDSCTTTSTAGTGSWATEGTMIGLEHAFEASGVATIAVDKLTSVKVMHKLIM